MIWDRLYPRRIWDYWRDVFVHRRLVQRAAYEATDTTSVTLSFDMTFPDPAESPELSSGGKAPQTSPRMSPRLAPSPVDEKGLEALEFDA